MEQFLNYVKDYYLLFTIVSAVLLLSLIGYLAEKNLGKDIKIKSKKSKKSKDKKANMTLEQNSSNEIDTL